MTIIKSGNNRVVIDEEPNEDHTHVQVVWFGPPQDGQHRTVFEGPLEPIEQYEAAVAWAVEMAAQMAYPLYVVPMTGVQVVRSEQVQRGFLSLTPGERGELRREVVATLARIMRDCGDRVVRADAYEVLVQMGLIRD